MIQAHFIVGELQNRITFRKSIFTLFVSLLFQPLMSTMSQVRHIATNPLQNSSQVCAQVLLSARCSGTVTSILLDISVEIRIFLKKDISHRNGFRLISLSRSNRVSLMFGYADMKVAGLEMCWRIVILPVLF